MVVCRHFEFSDNFKTWLQIHSNCGAETTPKTRNNLMHNFALLLLQHGLSICRILLRLLILLDGPPPSPHWLEYQYYYESIKKVRLMERDRRSFGSYIYELCTRRNSGHVILVRGAFLTGMKQSSYWAVKLNVKETRGELNEENSLFFCLLSNGLHQRWITLWTAK